MSGDNGWDALIAACERGWRRLSDEGFLYISDTALMSCPQCAALVALRDCDRHDDWHVYGPPTLPPSSRQRGPIPAKAVHDRRLCPADETDLRDDGGIGG